MAKGQAYKPFSDWTQERKENHIKYDQQNYSVVGAKLPREQANSFRALCKAQGVSVSASLSQYVRATLSAGTLNVIRDDIPGQKNIDPAFPQGDQANKNDTPGTVDLPTANDTPGTV